MNLPLGNQILALYLRGGVSISQGGGEAQRRRWTFYEAVNNVSPKGWEKGSFFYGRYLFST
jgi:hypothetical protein